MSDLMRHPSVADFVSTSDIAECTAIAYSDISGCSIINPTGSSKMMTVWHATGDEETFYEHQDDTGATVVITVDSLKSQQLPHAKLFGCHFIKLVAVDASTERLILTLKG